MILSLNIEYRDHLRGRYNYASNKQLHELKFELNHNWISLLGSSFRATGNSFLPE